ncbi:hypothetical protein KUCAC02_032578, partial [Chaenocephalus aceratus]
GTGLSWIHQYVCGRPLSSTSVFLLANRLKVDEGSGSPSNEAYGDIDLFFSRSKDLKGTGDTVKGTISDPETKNQSTQMMGRCYTSLRRTGSIRGLLSPEWPLKEQLVPALTQWIDVARAHRSIWPEDPRRLYRRSLTPSKCQNTLSQSVSSNEEWGCHQICSRGFKGYVYYNWDFALAFERIAYNDIKLSKAADLSEPQHEG